MTELERSMLEVMKNIAEMDVPVVFKGAMVVNLILAESSYVKTKRATRDFDMNWVSGTIPSSSELACIVGQALGEMAGKYEAVVKRESDENKRLV